MQSTPKTRRTPQNTQYTYDFNRRVYHVKQYPVQSPQGATILIYGHETGVTITWRGGKRLKATKQQPGSEKRNGAAAQDAVMVIDSDDETSTASAAFVDKPEFQDTPAADASSLPEFVQTLDLHLGTAVLGVAVPPIPNSTPEDAASNGISILQDKIVFAVTCSTTSVYVITLPLTPPSPESKARPELNQNLLAGNAGKGMWGETLTLLGGQSRPCRGIAISLVKPKTSPKSRPLERAVMQTNQTPRVIVAAHSDEASGTLRFWDVSLDGKPGAIDRFEPFQTEYLPSRLTSISFNPTNLTQLLAITSSHAVRIYDYSVPSLPSEDTSEGPFPSQGSWLLTLYPPFARGSPMSTERKPVVAAEWISHGRAILALLADGQWGIWDIDGGSPAGTAAASGSLFSKASAGLRGSAITSFSISGHLDGTSPLKNPAAQKPANASRASGEFVPLTPHTRRDAISSALGGGADKLSAVRGGISVTQLASRGAGPSDESVVLWLEGTDPIVSVVASISKFWDSKLRRAGGSVNLWSGSQPTHMTRLTDLSAGLLGERCTGAVAIPRSSVNTPQANTAAPPSENGSGEAENLSLEVLLVGEKRLVIVHESEDAAAASFNARLLGGRKKARLELGTTNAILAYPRPEKPNSVAFNLSIAHRPTGAGAGLFRPNKSRVTGGDSFESMDILPSTEPHEECSFSQPPGVGLRFINDLNFAADQPDDEAEAINRNIEEEMMDIMEIDRVMEQMESERERKKSEQQQQEEMDEPLWSKRHGGLLRDAQLRRKAQRVELEKDTKKKD
ncbi:nucleoporin NUP37 [Podospora fimiseda]|uniref:Nucleoporin NUP37 n=1 Tax=Podospora fimiseda TaxID=252190 RepID=A0AAN7BF65_9PEZI|nr:nucleoporin NUP37 [Podospora fimiseda]